MRPPVNTHVYLYKRNPSGEYEYAIFQRSNDAKCWQGVSGGVEDGETIEYASLRECFEEAGTSMDALLYRLVTISYLPADIFREHIKWGRGCRRSAHVLLCHAFK